jgi:glucosamine-phosphate N-acetyltransferase
VDFNTVLVSNLFKIEMDVLRLRPIECEDLKRGYFAVLSILTPSPEPTLEEFRERLDLMKQRDVCTFVVVDSVRDRIAGTLTVLIEPKFSRNLSFVAHVEDVVIHPDYQGNKLGQRLLQHACDFARSRGCYKVILDADAKNAGFYRKCGFVEKEMQFRFDIASK